jgi:hypothetical protein
MYKHAVMPGFKAGIQGLRPATFRPVRPASPASGGLGSPGQARDDEYANAAAPREN